MAYPYAERLRVRKSYGRLPRVHQVPYLLKGQYEAYEDFLCSRPRGEDAAAAPAPTPAKTRRKKGEGPSGLQEVLESIFPICSHNGAAELALESYRLGEPEYEPDECRLWGATYFSPLYAKVTLTFYESGKSRKIKKQVTGEEVFLGEVPRMNERGAFIINGTERAVVSQLRRSPGVLFESDRGRVHSSGKVLYQARIIPSRGAWLDFEFDAKDLVYARIDRKRKVPATVLLRALGMTDREMLEDFYQCNHYRVKRAGKDGPVQFELDLNPDRMIGKEAQADILAEDGETRLVTKGSRISQSVVEKLRRLGPEKILVEEEDLLGERLGQPLIDKETGESIGDINADITEEMLERALAAGIKDIHTLHFNEVNCGPYISDTLRLDQAGDSDRALVEIYHVMRPGEPVTQAQAAELFDRTFFQADRYDLSEVGRMKMNLRIGAEVDESERVLRKDDFREVLKKLVRVRDGLDEVDDVDNLGNRRVRTVGEMVADQLRIGLQRIEKVVAERLGMNESETLTPKDLVNAKPVTAALREFFGSSGLSQFMDQTNALSEVGHKRRLSAMGPSGLTRERAGYEVRDVHATHYGRLCPIETPEGPNIGLINSLACYTRVNSYGFLESPYRVVKDGVVTDEIEYLSPLDHIGCVIAQVTAGVDAKGKLTDELVQVRCNNEFALLPPEQVQYMDVAPEQIVSVAASLIPFLEHNDANRALMGSNMQRQGVPSLRSEKPLVGTGMERRVAADSGVCVVARRGGAVSQVDAGRIVVYVDEKDRVAGQPDVDIYDLAKYQRSNQDTCINQRPFVRPGDHVLAGDILADGASTDMGELSVGKNVRVAFMPWNGYNFEDSIVVSERLAWEDTFTSIHIKELTCTARDTRLGPEEITSDIPSINPSQMTQLDECGIVQLGAEVEAGDILVGRVTPRSEQQLTAEERLLRAVFGEKAGNVKDTSLRVPNGVSGVVIDVRILQRSDLEVDERTDRIRSSDVARLQKNLDDELQIVGDVTLERARSLLLGQKVRGGRVIKRDTKIGKSHLKGLDIDALSQVRVQDKAVNEELESVIQRYQSYCKATKKRYEGRIGRVHKSDNLSSGVRKVVKVYLAVHRRLQPGDKMSGRHGNKGVISTICPVQDMPYDESGRPVDIVLNPLGIPSRMNIGQVLETHLGWAAKGIGEKIGEMLDQKAAEARLREYLGQIYNHCGQGRADHDLDSLSEQELRAMAENLREGLPVATPAFDGANEDDIRALLELAGLPPSAQMQLYDGRTGDPFHHKSTIGYMYMLKLDHLADDKMHARSTGSYSLVTQQPLGGKANFGGQRFGEMEVWALEAYGAAHTLQEMLTVKSDDIQGRTNMYRNIVNGTFRMDSKVPESFNVLMREIRGLCIDLSMASSEFQDGGMGGLGGIGPGLRGGGNRQQGNGAEA